MFTAGSIIQFLTPTKSDMMRLQFFFQINRLPGMHSSNLMSDTLSGRDEMIDFEDVLNSKYLSHL